MVALTYRNLSTVGEVLNEPDTILKYLDQCFEVLSEHPDSVLYGDALYSKAFAYQTKGYYEIAVQSILEATRIFEDLNNDHRLGFMYHMLATNFSGMKHYSEAIDWNLKCIENWERRGQKFALVHAYNNIGGDYKNLDDYEEAKKWHIKANKLCKKLDQPYVQMLSAFNLSEIYRDKDNLDSCQLWVSEAYELAQEMQTPFILAGTNVIRADLALRNNKRNVYDYMDQAKIAIEKIIDPSEKESVIAQSSLIYKKMGDYKSAYDASILSQEIRDSVFTLEKSAQFEELHLVYETEKKDAAIKLLSKEAELDATRKKALWGGIILLGVSALSVIYSIVQRAKKKRLILEQENKLEVQKRENTERELEYKQKELTAKMLQLASKNEFLQKLELEVSDLKSSVDKSVGRATQRISRMISYDSSDDREWEQFGKEFSSIHSSFLNRLREQYGKFSKSELRLIALLKMNLSSKEIANTLRISDDGVKKARYRLRKKMELTSDIDIQQFFLNY